MAIEFLGKGGSDDGGCPTLYATDGGTYLAQGWETGEPGVVEIPHLLLGFVKPDTFIGSSLADTGRGTFKLTGRPVTDEETLSQLDLGDNETAIEVPCSERSFYGAVPGS